MCTEQFRHIELQNYKNEEEENESESNETAFMITHTRENITNVFNKQKISSSCILQEIESKF